MSGYEEFHATPEGGVEGAILRGSANEITVEASLGRMYDEGRAAGRVEGINETVARYERNMDKVRKAAVDEYKRLRKVRKAEKRQLRRYNEGGY